MKQPTMPADSIVLRAVEEAQAEILRHFSPLSSETVPLMQSLGRVLAANVQADIDVPPFANSAMDGYAVRGADVQSADPAVPVILRILGEVPAGGTTDTAVTPGSAIRIMTGAPMPPQADTVVPFEETDEGRPDSLHGQGQVRIFKPVPPAGTSPKIRKITGTAGSALCTSAPRTA
jgi:molybdopterin molybdotransferase